MADHSTEEALPLGHEYTGNLCGGLGGTTECEHLDLETGRRCGKSPFEHRSVPPELARLTPMTDQKPEDVGTVSSARKLHTRLNARAQHRAYQALAAKYSDEYRMLYNQFKVQFFTEAGEPLPRFRDGK